jgi:hypothetical protein
MKFKLKKSTFIQNILSPISTLVERAVVSISPEGITSIVNNTENNIILYISSPIVSSENIDLNIGDIKKLMRALDCVDQDEVEFNLSPGYISYETDDVIFKYHLLQSGIIQRHTIDINKINNLTFNTSFTLNSNSVQKILRATSFATETNKLYFYTKDNAVYVNLTDYTIPQSDNIGFKVSDVFQGDSLKTELPININTFKLLHLGKSEEVVVSIHTDLKILLFQIDTNMCKLKYIISGLVK